MLFKLLYRILYLFVVKRVIINNTDNFSLALSNTKLLKIMEKWFHFFYLEFLMP
jgi:hypothetical protein